MKCSYVLTTTTFIGILSVAGCNGGSRAKALLKGQILDSLNDPDTVKFRQLKLYKQGHPERIGGATQGRYALCGEEQSKNAFGVYTGWTIFYSVTSLKSETASQAGDSSIIGFIPNMVADSQLSESKEMAANYAMYCKDSEKIEEPLP